MIHRVLVDGLTITYERRGAGPALVLLHGGLSDHREWARQIDSLSDGYTVVAWDAPGCGGSSDPPATFRMPQYADVLARFIETLSLEHPHVVGLSWGSTLAIGLYERHPDLPRSLILASAYAGWAGSLPPDVVSERLTASIAQLARPPEEVARDFVPTLFSDRAGADMIAEAIALTTFRPSGALPMLHAMADADLRGVLPTIEVPTLLVHGGEDARSSMDVAHEMHGTIPGSSLVVIPGVGHQCNVEGAAAFDTAVRDFLAEV